MLQLYYAPGNASLIVHIVLEELAVPFELRLVDRALDQIDAELARHGGPWFLGDRYSVVDAYAFVLCRWTRGFARPARELSHIRPWLDRLLARPALQRAFASEKLTAPFV